ncbi:ERF family protein [Leuconostoc citreum]|uniref:ERF family protein n=1 Tax=Leuconostoc citreum TaxID=33964 RepID=UPI0020A1E1B1|nr:ERF family protein [Leuconostoc citreum]MCP1276287.1 ERF family protein [Leuconostoc citreum]
MTEFKNLYEALAETQNHIEQPKKDASNPMFKSSYVTLDAVINAIVNARKSSGAKFFFTNIVQDGIMITRIIGYGDTLDLSGSKVADDLGNRGTNSAQAEGSALTYARRYSLSMAFGIASDVDDDGNGASASNRKPAQPKLISKEKLALLERMITETSEFSGQDMMAFTLKAANVAALKFVTEENYKPLLAKVTEWHQKAEDKSNEPS